MVCFGNQIDFQFQNPEQFKPDALFFLRWAHSIFIVYGCDNSAAVHFGMLLPSFHRKHWLSDSEPDFLRRPTVSTF